MVQNQSKATRRIIGVDAGGAISGLCSLDGGKISLAMNLPNQNLYNRLAYLLLHDNCIVAVEDVKPYSLQVSQGIIDTCKFLGELTYRLRNEAGAPCVMVSRFEVKKWVYDTFPDAVLPRIRRKIDRKCFDACNVMDRAEVRVNAAGKPPAKPNFAYVDDRCVTEAMKALYCIPMPKPGDGYEYGLKDHSWQALGCASYYMYK